MGICPALSQLENSIILKWLKSHLLKPLQCRYLQNLPSCSTMEASSMGIANKLLGRMLVLCPLVGKRRSNLWKLSKVLPSKCRANGFSKHQILTRSHSHSKLVQQSQILWKIKQLSSPLSNLHYSSLALPLWVQPAPLPLFQVTPAPSQDWPPQPSRNQISKPSLLSVRAPLDRWLGCGSGEWKAQEMLMGQVWWLRIVTIYAGMVITQWPSLDVLLVNA